MDAYAATMNQPPQPHQQSPRGVTLEDGPPNPHRRNNSHFGSHDDFYAFLDSNRGPSMASTAGPSGPSGPNGLNGLNGPNERSPPPAPMPPQQQHQRNQPSQSRPPVTNIFPDRSRPPSYSGSRSEEFLVDKSANAKMARQNQRRGVPPTKPLSTPRQRTTSPTPPGVRWLVTHASAQQPPGLWCRRPGPRHGPTSEEPQCARMRAAAPGSEGPRVRPAHAARARRDQTSRR